MSDLIKLLRRYVQTMPEQQARNLMAEAADEIDHLQSKLEAERAEKRELREVCELVKEWMVTDSRYEEGTLEYLAETILPKLEQAIANTTAPTEAEIHAQRDREVADWLDKEYPNRFGRDIANELRQRAEGEKS